LATVHDVIILGSGPAGYTAALYAARSGLKPLLISGYQPGGQLTITTEVENYPGFREAIMGPELMERMRDQAAHHGTEIISAEAERVDFSQRPFKVWADGTLYEGRTVIVATGASAKLLGIPSEQKYMGFGVSACATCDGPFYKGRRVMVVGGGDTAMEEATYLTRLCFEVIVVHRRDELRASKIMQERALKNPRIKFIWDSEVAEVLGTEKPNSVMLSFMVESLFLALLGGALGCLIALPINGIVTSTTNFSSFSEVAFAFRVTPLAIGVGLVFAAVMGVVGGFLPSLHAARQPLAQSVREL
jgi:thioredoxin reductase (NADPH)